MNKKCLMCNISIDSNQVTCGGYCHDVFVLKMIEEYGKFKKIVDIHSGKAYKVPTKTIIEKGLKYQDLKNYPLW